MHLAAPLCTFMYPPPKLTWQWKRKQHLKTLKMYLLFKNGNVPSPWYSFITDSLLKQFQKKTTLQRRGTLFKKSIKVQEARIPRCAPWTKCDLKGFGRNHPESYKQINFLIVGLVPLNSHEINLQLISSKWVWISGRSFLFHHMVTPCHSGLK